MATTQVLLSFGTWLPSSFRAGGSRGSKGNECKGPRLGFPDSSAKEFPGRPLVGGFRPGHSFFGHRTGPRTSASLRAHPGLTSPHFTCPFGEGEEAQQGPAAESSSPSTVIKITPRTALSSLGHLSLLACFLLPITSPSNFILHSQHFGDAGCHPESSVLIGV